MMKKCILIVFLVSNAYIILKAQSGWTRSKNQFYIKTGLSQTIGKIYYDTDGNINKNVRTFYQKMLTLYGEYGITKNLTAIVNYPYLKYLHYKNFETVSGTANPQIELKYALLKKIPVISLALGAELPVSNQNNISYSKFEIAPGVKETINLPTGYADFNYWSTLAISSGLGNTPGWLTIFGQYIVRGKEYSNQAKLGFELGYKWTPKLWTNVRLTGFYKAYDKKSAQGNITNGEGQEYTILGLGGAYEFIEHWSVTADFQAYNDFLVRLKNVYSAPFYQIGISAEF